MNVFWMGYEDLNDHDQLRTDPLLATLVGKRDVTGEDRLAPRDWGNVRHEPITFDSSYTM
ncbi:MAG: hypothetical protein WD468_12305 [Pirellulales bacterium]